MYAAVPLRLNLTSSGAVWLGNVKRGAWRCRHIASVFEPEGVPIKNCVPTLMFALLGRTLGSQAEKHSGYP